MDPDALDRSASAEPEATTRVDDPASTSASPPWPPPALEPLLGAAWRVAWAAAAGSALLFGPLLYRLTGGVEAAGAPWWMADVPSVAGLILLALAASRAQRLLASARSALAAGHGCLTVAEVAADRRGDTGMLIAGAREYAGLPPEARTVVRVNRVAAAGLAVLAGALPSAGFLATVLLAYAGAADAGAALALTLWPLPAAGVPVLGALAIERVLLAAPRRAWSRREASSLRAEVDAWADRFEAARDGRGPGRGGTGAAGGVAAARLAAALLSLGTVAVAACALLFGSAAYRARRVAEYVPRFGQAVERFARVEAARPYRLPPDRSISPESAGRALHAVLLAGRAGAHDPLLRRPEPAYDEPWSEPAAGNPLGVPVSAPDWVRAAAAGLTPEQATYLRALAAHPALAGLATVARAGSIDILGTRYVAPLPDSLTTWTLPMVRAGAARAAARALVARALLELDAGRAAAAETTLREAISFGVLLADEAPFLLDGLTGAFVADGTLATLHALYEATGRNADAARIALLSDAVRRAAAVAGGGARMAAPPAAVALDAEAPRGLRWELASVHVVASECGSPRHRLFGETAAYREWKERARAALVRSAGEAALFELVVGMPLRAAAPRRASARGRAAALVARLLPGGPRCSAFWAAE